MKLMISDKTVEEILNFSLENPGVSAPIFEDYKVIVPLSKLCLEFFQPERYDKRIACFFDFGEGVGFFFETVKLAIDGNISNEQYHLGPQVIGEDVLKQNDDYVRAVLDYCNKHLQVISCSPPPWFVRAIEISNAEIRKFFPELADEDFDKKQRVLAALRMSTS
jgi:hypothetical protein